MSLEELRIDGTSPPYGLYFERVIQNYFGHYIHVFAEEIFTTVTLLTRKNVHILKEPMYHFKR